MIIGLLRNSGEVGNLSSFAWLPQLVDPARGAIALQTVIFGVFVMPLRFCNDSFYVLLAGTAREWLNNNTSFFNIQHYFADCIYFLIGLLAIR